MSVKKYLVIYERDDEIRAALLESEFPDSSNPYTWGLGADCGIIAVIDIDSGPRVWVDEIEIELDEDKE